MSTITRRLEFDSGHRVLGHEGKCRHLHGHRYAAELTIDAPALDELGRVIDFGIVKELVGAWIDEFWDHNLLLHRDDPLATVLDAPRLLGGKQPYFMKYGNPTAENIADELFEVAQDLLSSFGFDYLLVRQVRIYETPNCWADCTARRRTPQPQPGEGDVAFPSEGPRTMHSKSQ